MSLATGVAQPALGAISRQVGKQLLASVDQKGEANPGLRALWADLSARWPGDAHTFAKRFAAMLDAAGE